MTKWVILVIISSVFLPSFVFMPAHGDGLASEILPPEMIGNKNVTLSINSSPFLIDNNHVGTQINFILQDASTQEPIPEVTLAVSAFKNDQALFGHVFMSDNGNFLFDVTPDNSTDKITINEEGGILPGLLGHGGSYQIEGPVFASGGLYKFKIDVLTMGSYNYQVRKTYNAAISIPITTQYPITDGDDGKQTITITAYYDQIGNFQYDSNNKKMSFSMPFNWNQDNLKQVTVVHQELKIPRTFSSFIVTKYDAYVNGVALPDNAVSIDDYSSDDQRIIHLILYKQEVNTIATQNSTKSEMDFTLSPSNETAFPIMQYTRNAQYKISLSWDPPKILAGHTTKFSFQILDPYLVNKTVNSIDYDFSIIEGKNGLLFHDSSTTNNNGDPNTEEVNFPANYTGPITIGFENLNGNSFSDSEISGVVSQPHTIPEFPTGSLIVIVTVFSLAIMFPRLSKI